MNRHDGDDMLKREINSLYHELDATSDKSDRNSILDDIKAIEKEIIRQQENK